MTCSRCSRSSRVVLALSPPLNVCGGGGGGSGGNGVLAIIIRTVREA